MHKENPRTLSHFALLAWGLYCVVLWVDGNLVVGQRYKEFCIESTSQDDVLTFVQMLGCFAPIPKESSIALILRETLNTVLVSRGSVCCLECSRDSGYEEFLLVATSCADIRRGECYRRYQWGWER